MLTLLRRSRRTLNWRSATHTPAATQRLRRATRRVVITFSALAVACLPILSVPASAQSSITGLSANSGSTLGGTEVTFDGELKASFKQVKSNPEADFSLALTNTGELYAWGSNSRGQLGDGTTINRDVPVRVDMTGVLAGKVVTQIAVGSYESYALTTEGKVYAWGENWGGALGDGTTTNRSTPVAVDTSGALTGKFITQIATTQYSVIVLTSEGTLFGWGGNYNGELATGAIGGGPHTPRAVGASGALSGKTITQIGAGLWWVFAATSDGELYSWGSNNSGQLGDGTTTSRTTPTLVTALSGQTVTALAGGDNHSLALTNTGAVYAWGWNGRGQLGDGTTTWRTTPTLVTALSGQTVTALAGGANHSLALTNTGAVYAWGDNWGGQLGDGTTTDRTTPTLVTALSGQIVSTLAGGYSHSLATTNNGAVYAWGDNWGGQLGDGTTTDRTTPAPIDTTNVIVHTPTVTFGGIPATGVEIVDGPSSKQLKATTPAHAPGVVDVVVSFPGEVPITLTGAYTYLATTTVELSGITHSQDNGIAPALANGSLSASGACSSISEPSVTLRSPTGASTPANVSLYGGVSFSLDCTSNGEAATVSIALSNAGDGVTASLPAITNSNIGNLRAYKSHSGGLTDITGLATFTLVEGSTVLVSYELVDGGELDEDGLANGTIIDPVYIGYYRGGDITTDDSGTLADTGSSTLGLAVAGVALVLSSVTGACIAIARRPRFTAV